MPEHASEASTRFNTIRESEIHGPANQAVACNLSAGESGGKMVEGNQPAALPT
jgi:hypothetical protein